MDFFTVPTVTFGVLYWFFAISHVAGVFCTATSHGIRQPCGLFSGCGKRFHRAPRPFDSKNRESPQNLNLYFTVRGGPYGLVEAYEPEG
jgi:hypothetical protein